MSAGAVVWFTGLPASGKSTLAMLVHAQLVAAGLPCCVLDSDAVRAALVPSPGYGERERDDFYASLGNLACLLAWQGLSVLVPATANRRDYRDRARRVAPRFIEVHIAATLEECRGRDRKRLYARSNHLPGAGLPGSGAPYEAPIAPDVIAHGGCDPIAAARVVELIRQTGVELDSRRSPT